MGTRDEKEEAPWGTMGTCGLMAEKRNERMMEQTQEKVQTAGVAM